MSTQEQIHSDKFSQYLTLRSEYVESLREHDLLDASGHVRREIVENLSKSDIAIPDEDSALGRYCMEHPDDRLCWLINVRDMVEQFLDVRGTFLDEIEQADLGEVQQFVVGVTEAGRPGGLMGGANDAVAGMGTAMRSGGSVSLVGPDQDIDDIPWWLRPYVDPGRVAGEMSRFDGRFGTGVGARAGAIGTVGEVTPDQPLDDFPRPLWPYITPARAGLAQSMLAAGSFTRGADFDTALLY
jgi:hypothetical protein